MKDLERFEAIKHHHLLNHDPSFVYAPTRSKIYCRPSCRARRKVNYPHEIRIFDSCEHAQKCGMRPCKRCHPNQTDIQFMPPETKVRQVCEVLIKKPQLNWKEAMQKCGFSKHHGHRTFKEKTGMTPIEFVQMVEFDREQAISLCQSVDCVSQEIPEQPQYATYDTTMAFQASDLSLSLSTSSSLSSERPNCFFHSIYSGEPVSCASPPRIHHPSQGQPHEPHQIEQENSDSNFNSVEKAFGASSTKYNLETDAAYLYQRESDLSETSFECYQLDDVWPSRPLD